MITKEYDAAFNPENVFACVQKELCHLEQALAVEGRLARS
jgi:hypothetical protein